MNRIFFFFASVALVAAFAASTQAQSFSFNSIQVGNPPVTLTAPPSGGALLTATGSNTLSLGTNGATGTPGQLNILDGGNTGTMGSLTWGSGAFTFSGGVTSGITGTPGVAGSFQINDGTGNIVILKNTGGSTATFTFPATGGVLSTGGGGGGFTPANANAYNTTFETVPPYTAPVTFNNTPTLTGVSYDGTGNFTVTAAGTYLITVYVFTDGNSYFGIYLNGSLQSNTSFDCRTTEGSSFSSILAVPAGGIIKLINLGSSVDIYSPNGASSGSLVITRIQ